MDVTPYLAPRIAPRAIFDSLDERGSHVRFQVPTEDGTWRGITVRDHADSIERCARYLAEHLEPGDRAAIFAPNRVEWMAAALAIQAVGGAMVPIYASSTAEQAAYIVAHSDAKVIFVDTAPLLARLLEAWPQLEGLDRVVLLDDALDARAALADLGPDAPAYAEVEPKLVTWSEAMRVGAERALAAPDAFARRMDEVPLEATAVMLYTSGTSGRPKGVPLTHRNVAVNGADWLRSMAPQLAEDDVDLLWLPFSHIFGFGEACLGNTLGWTSYLSDPRSVMDGLTAVRPHVFMSVPSVWEKLAVLAGGDGGELTRLTGGRLRFCLSGGAGLKVAIKERFEEAGMLILEGYGLTEASPTLTLNRPDAFRFDTVGKPLPSVELRLADDGEILARGDSIFSGYHKEEAATREAFTDDGWLKTGDVGRWTDDGFLQIIDRKKDIFVTAGGKNIAPANIEVRFRDDPFIAHLIVYGDGRKYLTAAVWLDDAACRAELASVPEDRRDSARHALAESRVTKVNGELARHETIKKLIVVEEPLSVEGGLLTPTLKPKRKKIVERYAERLEALYG